MAMGGARWPWRSTVPSIAPLPCNTRGQAPAGRRVVSERRQEGCDTTDGKARVVIVIAPRLACDAALNVTPARDFLDGPRAVLCESMFTRPSKCRVLGCKRPSACVLHCTPRASASPATTLTFLLAGPFEEREKSQSATSLFSGPSQRRHPQRAPARRKTCSYW